MLLSYRQLYLYLAICLSIISTGSTFPAAKAEKLTSAFQVIDTSAINKKASQLFESSQVLYEEGAIVESSRELVKALKLFKQSKNNDGLINCLLAIGENYSELGDSKLALAYYQKALKRATDSYGGIHPNVASCYDYLGLWYADNGSHELAMENFNNSLLIHLKLSGNQSPLTGEVYSFIGYAHESANHEEQALFFYEKACAIFKKDTSENSQKLLSTSLNYIAHLYLNKGQADLAGEYFDEAYKITRVLVAQNDPAHALHYNNLGGVYMAQANYDKAQEYFKQSLSLYKAIESNAFAYDIALCYNNIGGTYQHKGGYQDALVNYLKAFELFKRLYGELDVDVALSANNLGATYLELGNYDKATSFFNKALAIHNKIQRRGHPDAAIFINNLGYVYLQQGNWDKALLQFQKSQKIWTEELGSRHPFVARTYRHIAQVYAEKGDRLRALNLLQEALTSNVIHFENKNFTSNPKLEEVLSQNELLEILRDKSKLLLELYHLNTGQEAYLKAALSTTRLAVELIDDMRAGFRAEKAKYSLTKLYYNIYQLAVETSIELYKVSQDKHYQLLAFIMSEKSKSVVLLESIKETDAKQLASIPLPLMRKEQRFKAKLAYLEKSLLDEKTKGKMANEKQLDRLGQELFENKQAYERLIDQFEAEYPTYYNFRYNINTAQVTDIQRQLLQKEDALVEYFVGEHHIHMFVLTANDFRIHSTPRSTKLNEELVALKQFFRESSSSTRSSISVFANTSFYLYQQLFQPIEPFIKNKHLIIIPDNELAWLPFEVLIKSDPKTVNSYSKLDYLIKSHHVNYAFSGTLLQLQDERASKVEVNKQCIAFAPSYNSNSIASSRYYGSVQFARSAQVSDLPGAKKEIDRIASFVDGKYFTGALATEENFKQQAGNYAVIHLAMHSFADERHPINSRLLFSEASDQQGEDGVLYAYELYNMNINTQLAVLSACKTGTGKSVKGEGVMSMGRAFTYMGCPSVVMSLWEASDKFTPQIMAYFYEALSEGMSKSEALREAKLKFLNSADEHASNPVYWAAFIAIGSDVPVDINKVDDNQWLLWVLLSLVILLGIIWAKRRTIFN